MRWILVMTASPRPFTLALHCRVRRGDQRVRGRLGQVVLQGGDCLVMNVAPGFDCNDPHVQEHLRDVHPVRPRPHTPPLWPQPTKKPKLQPTLNPKPLASGPLWCMLVSLGVT